MEVTEKAGAKRDPARARRPRHTETAEVLGRRIVGGTLAPGAVLPNADLLAREFKVSRPALREAIKLLAGKGLLEMAPRRGTTVRPRAEWNRLDDDVISWELGEAPTDGFFRNLFELRRIIEPEAAALASERASAEGLSLIGDALTRMGEVEFDTPESVRADLDFHRAILAQSGNDLLATFGPAIEASLSVTFRLQRSTDDDSKRFLREHGLVYDGIRARDPAAARSAVLALLRRAEADALHALAIRGTGAIRSRIR